MPVENLPASIEDNSGTFLAQSWPVIAEQSVDLICTVDDEGRILDVSPNCERLTGWRREQLRERPFLDFIAPDDREEAAASFQARKHGPRPPAALRHYCRADGGTMPMSWSMTWTADGRICHCIGRDMSDHEAWESAVHDAIRAGRPRIDVAHDFNNVLTVILGNSELLACRLAAADEKGMAETIAGAARRCADLTVDLLAAETPERR